jgi:geranylgeranyl pyrophosphate synthase
MSQLVSEYMSKSKQTKNGGKEVSEDIKLQIKNYAYNLTMQISEPDNGSYLLEALSDCANSELFQMIGGYIAGCIYSKKPVSILW